MCHQGAMIAKAIFVLHQWYKVQGLLHPVGAVHLSTIVP